MAKKSDGELKDVLVEWKDMLIGTLLYHAERVQLNLQSKGRIKLSALKNKFLSHPYVLNYKEKFGFDLEHFSHRITGAVTHRDWHALFETLKSLVKPKQSGGDENATSKQRGPKV